MRRTPGRRLRTKCDRIQAFVSIACVHSDRFVGAQIHNVRIHRGLPAAAGAPVALTIGNFDGVHRGHQAMLARLIEAADDLRLPPAVLTFDPHPREFFQRDGAPPRLTKLRQKLDLFRTLGVAITFVARFDARLAALSPAAFIDDVLVARLGVRWVLVGDDFRFGAARAGDLATLRAHARTFSVEGMRTIVVSEERASSQKGTSDSRKKMHASFLDGIGVI
jgi:riboflavin kinase/FMN adenylyltransferase